MTMYKWFYLFFGLSWHNLKKKYFRPRINVVCIQWLYDECSTHLTSITLRETSLWSFCFVLQQQQSCSVLHFVSASKRRLLVFWSFGGWCLQKLKTVFQLSNPRVISILKLYECGYNWLVIIFKLKTLEFGKRLTICMLFFCAQRPF